MSSGCGNASVTAAWNVGIPLILRNVFFRVAATEPLTPRIQDEFTATHQRLATARLSGYGQT